MTSRSRTLLSGLKHHLGLDRAIAFTFLARAVQILGSIGTVLLIVHFLTPLEQGYYYTLLSLVALQVIFELGFSFVVLQLAAHESALLRFREDGGVEGDAYHHARLASALQQSTKWYMAAALLMGVTLASIGSYLFSRHTQAQVHWQIPWISTVVVCVLTFVQVPAFAFLEGCGQVLQVAHIRMWQSLAGTALGWTTMILHHGLFSPAMLLAGNALVGLAFFWNRRRFLAPLLRYDVGNQSIAWREEVWPFQWRTAISCMGTYFTAQVFVPILFAFRGAVEAGHMGMSLSITGYIGTLVLSWMHTKAAPFGRLVAHRDYAQLDKIFFRTLKQSLAILVGVSTTCIATLITLQYVYPELARRMVSPAAFALLVLTGISNYIVQSEALYLRAHKREPFVTQSSVVVVLTVATTFYLAPRWGTGGLAFGYFVCSGVVGLAIATVIFQRRRRERDAQEINVPEATTVSLGA
jgi:hypothetical protein